MANCNWTRDFPHAITVCDLRGIVLEMNENAASLYRQFGGKELIGKSLLDCHPEPARGKLLRLLESGEHNVYTIQKSGMRKLIYQAPWYNKNQRGGMVELALEIPFDLPHFIR
jgi:transcriptional regulator with PAS, ATPase and Fis domain